MSLSLVNIFLSITHRCYTRRCRSLKFFTKFRFTIIVRGKWMQHTCRHTSQCVNGEKVSMCKIMYSNLFVSHQPIRSAKHVFVYEKTVRENKLLAHRRHTWWFVGRKRIIRIPLNARNFLFENLGIISARQQQIAHLIMLTSSLLINWMSLYTSLVMFKQLLQHLCNMLHKNRWA